MHPESSPLPPFETFGELLVAQAASLGDRPHLHLLDETEHATSLSFVGLADEARRYAAGLRRAGVRPDDRVLLMLDTGVPLVALLYGCHLVGAIPVPLYPPFRLQGVAPYLERLARILAQAEGSLFVAEAGLLPLLRLGLGPRAPRLVAPESLRIAPTQEAPFPHDPERPAVIQFSSGSTGPQKGVVLTHRQVMANCRALGGRLGFTPGMRGCSWLPLYHDMGLIGCVFTPLLFALEGWIFPPKAFLLDPAMWLRVIDRHRCAIVTGPNFAYALLKRRVDPAELSGLDLSCVTIALNGAEPVDPAMISRFESHFGPLGWPKGALIGVYGLAEVGLAATMPTPGGGTAVDRIDPQALIEGGRAEPTPEGRAIAAVGRPLDGYRLEIRDAEGRVLGERQEGEIALAGPSVTSGYWREPEETARALQDGWLLTGDLGYMADGQLFVTGRSKDLIIRGGRNYHPHALEHAAEAVTGVRAGAAVAFGVQDERRGTERVVLVVETREPASTHVALARTVAAAVEAATGLRPDQVVALPPGAVPKTSSGKRQRRATREKYLAGTLGRSPNAADALRVAAGHHFPALAPLFNAFEGSLP